MSRHELLEALRRDAELALAAVRAAVERDEEAMRATAELQLAELQDADAATLRLLTAREHAAVVGTAQRDARRQRLLAEERLAVRLRRLAEEELDKRGRAGGAALWQRLADEVPAGEWARIVVTPRDVELARRRFPAAEIAVAPTCSGGLLVEGEYGRVRVDNRLATRLSRGWDDLLPRLWHDPRLRAARSE